MKKTFLNKKATAENNNGGILSSKISKLLTIFALAIFIGLSANNATTASSPNPPPDCPETPFLGPRQGVLEMPPNCIITYTYYYRYACHIWYDTYISEFSIQGDCQFDPQYRNVIDAIQADIVVSNPWQNIPEAPPTPEIPLCGPLGGPDAITEGILTQSNSTPGWSVTQWRFFRPICSATIERWIDGNLVIEVISCPATGYCFKTYRYCWREIPPGSGRRVLQSQETGGGAFSLRPCEQPCIANCSE